MSGSRMDIDADVLYDCLERGMTLKEMSEVAGFGTRAISKKIREMQEKQGLLTQYRSIQSLQLTELQARILENITEEKIAEAPLRDLVLAFKILKEHELVIEGKPSQIKGLVGYLIQLEKEEAGCLTKLPDSAVVEVEFSSANEDWVPNI